jgi:CubicO group peptidase (beta-lactamase class C family)
MRHFCIFLALSGFLGGLRGQTGIPVPEMAHCDAQVMAFMNQYDIPSATFALARNGKLVYMRAFGHADRAGQEPTQPHHLFRIASVSKPITAIAVMKLVEQGQLSLDDKAFGPGGRLASHPYLGAVSYADARINQITVRHLLEHSAGWNRSIDCVPNPTTPYSFDFNACDPISFPLHVTQTLGEPNPVTEEMHIRFLMEKGLNFAPGTAYAYSNIGYLVLGEIIEAVSGLSYEDFVKQEVLDPIGACDMHLGRNLAEDKREREGEYVGNGFVVPSLYGTGQNVPWEYGGWNLEAMDAHGGWIATARDLVRLLTAVDGFSTRPDLLSAASIQAMTAPSANNSFYAKGWQVNSANNWWHTGALDGTASIWVRASNGSAWALILNKRVIGANANAFWADLDNLPWNCLSQTSSFPAHDFFDVPSQGSSGLQFSGVSDSSLALSWAPGSGDRRILVAKEGSPVDRFPLDGTSYAADARFGAGQDLGNGNFAIYDGSGSTALAQGLDPAKTYHFRLFEYKQRASTGNHALYQLCRSAQDSSSSASTSSIGGLEAWQFRLYPNPGQGLYWLEAAQAQGPVWLSLSDPAGRVLLEQSYDPRGGKPFRLDLSGRPAGLYVLKIAAEGHRPSPLKLLHLPE